jgi:hypothetical protein
MSPPWSPGDHVVLRHTGLDNGWVVGWPQVFVEETAERVVLYQPPGTTARNVFGVGEDLRSQLMPAGTTRTSWPDHYTYPLAVLRIMPSHAAHAIEIQFGHGVPTPPQLEYFDDGGNHRGYKVNLQAPFVRTSLGFDTTDNALDIVMGTDLDWHWKDEDQIAVRVAVGLTSEEEAAAFRAEGERVIADIERRAYPFDQPGTNGTLTPRGRCRSYPRAGRTLRAPPSTSPANGRTSPPRASRRWRTRAVRSVGPPRRCGRR